MDIELAVLQCLQQALLHGVEEVQAFDGLLRGDADPWLTQALQVTLARAGVTQSQPRFSKDAARQKSSSH